MTHIVPVIKGLATYIPGLYTAFGKRETLRGGNHAEYYYDIWLKHLTFLYESGMRELPRTLAELGPGHSLGLGLTALLSGVDRYCALDVVPHETQAQSLAMFDRLVSLLQKRAGRSRQHTPDFDRYLDQNGFPSHVLTEGRLRESLAPARVALIREALLNRGRETGPITIEYVAPWHDPEVVDEGSVDVIISHSVMEYVADLEDTYRTCARWLAPGGWMSHQIDLRSHDITEEWNGNWAYSDAMWKLVMGRRPYFLNRQPCSRHLMLIEKAGFDIRCAIRVWRGDGLPRAELAREWQDLSDEDLACAGLFVQARKRAAAGHGRLSATA